MRLHGQSLPAAKHARHRFVQPGIDLKVAVFDRSESQFYAAIGTNKRLLTQTTTVLHAQMEKPFIDAAAADFAISLAHFKATIACNGYIIDCGQERVLGDATMPAAAPALVSIRK
jgi:hypothetical protein